MTWRLRVRHQTGYTYETEVASSFNEARLTPLTDGTQTTLESRIEIKPSASMYRYRDYWGTRVTSFDIHAPHSELQVVATSVVETHLRPGEPGDLDWADLRSDTVADRYSEWLRVTPRTDPDDELTELARAAAGSLSPSEAATACLQAAREGMEYVFGATGVKTSGAEAWQARKGVCQDFAHISLAMLRSLQIPSRYVSGYLHPQTDAAIGEAVPSESHAWVEWWDGAWVGYDPTNGKLVVEQHVVVARGRDYDDVAPLKGIYSGSGTSTLGVRVEMTRMA